MLLRVAGFNGAVLKDSPKILPDDVGVNSLNLRPDRQDFRVWRSPSTVATVPASQNSIYRMGRDTPNDSAYWLSQAQDTDFMPGFLGSDTSERTYFTGAGGIPQWTDNLIGLTAAPYPTVSRPLGVPSPLNQPTLAIQAAGSGASTTRYYVATWVTDKGEESMPSLVSAQLTCNSDATVRVTRVSSMPSDGRVYSYWRVYRTQSNGASTAGYYFVAQVLVATAYYDDPSGALSTTLPSLYWSMPDPGLKGLIALWNGIAAGFVGKRLCFSEPYRAFTWPANYELATRDTIVGLGVWRQNLLVLTTSIPYIVNGNHPSAMTMQPLDLHQPCMSKRSIVSFGDRVVWASPSGLVSYGDNGAVLLTDSSMSRDQWQALVPSTIRSARVLNSLYMGNYTSAGVDAAFFIDLRDPRGIYFQSAGYVAAYYDPIQDTAFVLSGTSVQRWDGATYQPGVFKSKIYRADKPHSFAWAQVAADSFPVTLSVWADGALLVNAMSVASGAPFRLPSGAKYRETQAQITASDGVQALLLADTTEELKLLP